MRVLLLHNHYQQAGGEDQVFAAESTLLETHGHEVIRYTAHNDRLAQMGAPTVAGATVFNVSAYRELRGLIRVRRPDVMHVHNTFPLISPAAYYAAGAEGVPVCKPCIITVCFAPTPCSSVRGMSVKTAWVGLCRGLAWRTVAIGGAR